MYLHILMQLRTDMHKHTGIWHETYQLKGLHNSIKTWHFIMALHLTLTL